MVLVCKVTFWLYNILLNSLTIKFNEFTFVANQTAINIDVQGLNNFDAVVTVVEVNGRKQKTILIQDNTYSGATESIVLTNLIAGNNY